MLRKKISEFLADRRGSIAIMTAVTLPIFVGGIAMGTDVGFWYAKKTNLSFNTDAAAISAANMYQKGLSQAIIDSAVRQSLLDNGIPDNNLTLSIDPPDSEDRVTVVASYQTERFFSSFISTEPVVVSSRTVAQLSGDDEACVLALSRSASRALDFGGSTEATFDGCFLASNSEDDEAIAIRGATDLTAECLTAAGGINGAESATLLGCTAARPDRRPISDPYASIVAPATPTSCENAPNSRPNNSVVFNASGTVCYRDNRITLQGVVDFQPGVYVLDGTDLQINSGANVTGDDVTFVLRNGASLNFNGNATIDLSAPEADSGQPYPGILFLGTDGNNASHSFNGNANSDLQGVVYLPSDDADFNGNAGFDVECIRLVADTIDLQGNLDIDGDCDIELANNIIPVTNRIEIIE